MWKFLTGNAPVVVAKPRFGLAEVKLALPFTKTAEQAQAVLAVVVGVLGYENRVAADIEAASTALDRDITGSRASIGRNRDRIASLTAANQELESSITVTTGHKTELTALGVLFQTPAA